MTSFTRPGNGAIVFRRDEQDRVGGLDILLEAGDGSRRALPEIIVVVRQVFELDDAEAAT